MKALWQNVTRCEHVHIYTHAYMYARMRVHVAWCSLNGRRLRKVRFLPVSRHSLGIMRSSSVSFPLSVVRSASDLTGSDALYDHRYKYTRTRHAGTETPMAIILLSVPLSSSYKFSSFFLYAVRRNSFDFDGFSMIQLQRKYNVKKRTIVIVKSRRKEP